MRDASLEIAKLCESCWERLADSSKIEQRGYAQDLLRLLGWEQPLPFTPKEGAASLSAAPYLLRAGGQTAVAAYFVMPGALEPPSTIVARGLDFCDATRLLVLEAASLNVNYTLISDLYRSYLYDVRTDELLLFADTPKMFNQELMSVLTRTNMERGALEEIRRQPRSVVAGRLGEWRQRWIDALCSRGRISEDHAAVAVDRLVVIRYLFDHDILRRTKWRLQQRFEELTRQAADEGQNGCGAALVHLFHDMWLDWRIDLFEVIPELDQVLSQDGIAVPLLNEFALLSRGKFSIATILESFNVGDPAEKLRVRMVPDVNEEREHYLAKQRLETIDSARIEIDLMEEGYRAVFHWFDKVIALYDRLSVDFDAKAYQKPLLNGEMDLFAWSQLDAGRPRACADKMAYACERGFGIYYSGPRQYRIGRLLLTLHLISRYDQSRQAVNTFPTLRNVMMKRPLVLRSERIMASRPAANLIDDLDSYGEV